MTEPLRWLHDERVPPALRGILAANSGDIAFPDGVRLRVAQRIAATTATSLAVLGAAELANAAGSANASASAAVGTGTGAVGVGASAGVGVTAAAGVKLTATIASIALGAAVTTAAVVQHERERVVSFAAPIAAPFVEKARAFERAAASRRERGVPSSTELRPIGELPVTVDELPLAAPTEEPRVAGRAAHGNGLEREVSELRALRVLVKQSPAQALSRLHATESGQFAAERRLLEVQALLALGRRSEATAVGERILADPAASWYHERVRSLLGKSSAPPKDLAGSEHSPSGSKREGR